MLFMFLIVLGLVTIGAYATPTARIVGGLEVSLSTPTDKVASASELRVIATVRNVGDKDLKVIKFGTVLDDDLRTPSFTIRKDGKEVHFTRVAMVSELMNRLSENHPSEDDWVVIQAGETARAEHNVSTAYDFSTSGPGTFTLDSISRFRIVGLDGTVETNIANTHSVTVTITDGAPKHKIDLRKRATVDCFKPDWAAILETNLRAARFLALVADLYVRINGPEDPLYKEYFGTSDPETVMFNWGLIMGEGPSTVLHCQTMHSECKDTLLYYPRGEQVFYFCPTFFSSAPYDRLCNGSEVDKVVIGGGEMISALALATIPDTKSEVVTCSDARKMPNDKKLNNAFNYRCFALQVYQNTRCN